MKSLVRFWEVLEVYEFSEDILDADVFKNVVLRRGRSGRGRSVEEVTFCVDVTFEPPRGAHCGSLWALDRWTPAARVLPRQGRRRDATWCDAHVSDVTWTCQMRKHSAAFEMWCDVLTLCFMKCGRKHVFWWKKNDENDSQSFCMFVHFKSWRMWKNGIRWYYSLLMLITHALHMHCSEVTHLAGNLHCPDPTMWWSGFTRRPSLIILQTYFRHTSEILQIYFGHTSKNTWNYSTYFRHLQTNDCRKLIIPVVPHKAVAEVSKIANYRRGELPWCMDSRANPVMNRKVVGVVLVGVVAVVSSPTTAECGVV